MKIGVKTMSELIDLLRKMEMDEYRAPEEYQKIINLLPTDRLKNLLRINQRQEREHLKKVREVIRQVEK